LSGSTVVIGCGGGGCNTVFRLKNSKLPIVTINTGNNESKVTISMADKSVNGCRGDPDLAWALASDYADNIREQIEGYSNVIVTAGLGGGTGAGVIPIIAECAKESKARFISVVSIPMASEKERSSTARTQMREIIQLSERTIIFDMDKVFNEGGDMIFNRLLLATDRLISQAIERLAEMLEGPFFSMFSERVYTVAYASSLDPVCSVQAALSSYFFDTDPNYGKIIVNTDSKFTNIDKVDISEALCNKTGILPEVIVGKVQDSYGMMLFFPISYTSLLS